MPVILAIQEAEIRRIIVQNQPWQIVSKTLSRKNSSQQRAGRVVQEIRVLPSKHEAQSSNLSVT
jgi:hypothetical protein